MGDARYRQNAEALGVLLEEGRAVHVSPRAATGWFHARVAAAEAKAIQAEQGRETGTGNPDAARNTLDSSITPPTPVVSRAASSVHVDVQVTQRQRAAREALFATPYKRITRISSEPLALQPLPKHRPAKSEVELVKRHVNTRRQVAALKLAGSSTSTPVRRAAGRIRPGQAADVDKGQQLRADALPSLLSPIKPRLSGKVRLAKQVMQLAKLSTTSTHTGTGEKAKSSLSPNASSHANTVGFTPDSSSLVKTAARGPHSSLAILTQAGEPAAQEQGVEHATGLQGEVEHMALAQTGDNRSMTSDSLFALSVRSASITSPSAAHRHAEREASFNPMGSQLQRHSSGQTTPSARMAVAQHSAFGEHSVYVSSAYAVWALLFLRRTLRHLSALPRHADAPSGPHRPRHAALSQPTLLQKGSDLSSGMAASSQGPVFWRNQAAALRATGLEGSSPGTNLASVGPSRFDKARTGTPNAYASIPPSLSPASGSDAASTSMQQLLLDASARSRLSPTAAHSSSFSEHAVPRAALPSLEDEKRAHRIAMDAGIAGGGALGYGCVGVYPLPAGSRQNATSAAKQGMQLMAGRRGAKLQVQAVITAAQLGAAQAVLPRSVLRFLGISGDAVRASANTSSMHQLMLDMLEAAEMKRAIAIAYAHAQCQSSLSDAHAIGLHRRKARACMVAMSQRDVQRAQLALAQLSSRLRADAATDEALAGLGVPGAPKVSGAVSAASNPRVRLKPLPLVGLASNDQSGGPLVLPAAEGCAGPLEGLLHAATAPLLAQAILPNPKLALTMARAAHKSALAASKTTNVTGSAFKKSAFGVRPYPEVLVSEGACTRVTMEATSIKVELTLSDTVSRRAVMQLERELILRPPRAAKGGGRSAGRFDADAHIDKYFGHMCSALQGAAQQRRLSAAETGVEGTIRGDKDVMSLSLSLHHAQLCRLPHLSLVQRCSVAMLFQELVEAQVLLVVHRVDASHCEALVRGGLPLQQLPVRSLSKLRSGLGSLLARGRLSDAFAGVVMRVCNDASAYDVVRQVSDGRGPSAVALLDATYAPQPTATKQAPVHTDRDVEAANAAVPMLIRESGVFSVFLQAYQLEELVREMSQESRAVQATMAISALARASKAATSSDGTPHMRRTHSAAPDTAQQQTPSTVRASRKVQERPRPWREPPPRKASADSRPLSAATVRSHSALPADSPALRVSNASSHAVLRAQRALLAWGKANKTQDSNEEQRQQALATLAARRLQHAQQRQSDRLEAQREEGARLAIHGQGGLGGSLSTPQLPSARALAADVQHVMGGRGNTATGVARGGLLAEQGLQDADGSAPADVDLGAGSGGMARYSGVVRLQEWMGRFTLDAAEANAQLCAEAAGEEAIAVVWQRCALLGDLLVLLLTVSSTMMQPAATHLAVVRGALQRSMRHAFLKDQHGDSSARSGAGHGVPAKEPPLSARSGAWSSSASSSGDEGAANTARSGESSSQDGRAQRHHAHLQMSPEDELETLLQHPQLRQRALESHPALGACKVLLGSTAMRQWLARTQEVALAGGPMVLTSMGPAADMWSVEQQSLGLMCPAPVLLQPLGAEFLRESGVAPSAIRAAASVAARDGFGLHTAAQLGVEVLAPAARSHAGDDIAAALNEQVRGVGLGGSEGLPLELHSAAASLRQAGQHVRAAGVTATSEEMSLAAQLWLQRLVDAVLHELFSLLERMRVTALTTAVRVPSGLLLGRASGDGGGAAREGASAPTEERDSNKEGFQEIPLLDLHAWLGSS